MATGLSWAMGACIVVALLLDLYIVLTIWGLVGVFIAFGIAPITYVLIPLFAIAQWNEWLPATIGLVGPAILLGLAKLTDTVKAR